MGTSNFEIHLNVQINILKIQIVGCPTTVYWFTHSIFLLLYWSVNKFLRSTFLSFESYWSFDEILIDIEQFQKFLRDVPGIGLEPSTWKYSLIIVNAIEFDS